MFASIPSDFSLLFSIIPAFSPSKTDSAFSVGDFIAVFDPIDGSKNIDASLPVGSIFGIYKKQPGSDVDSSTFLQDGTSLVAAGYCLFS